MVIVENTYDKVIDSKSSNVEFKSPKIKIFFDIKSNIVDALIDVKP